MQRINEDHGHILEQLQKAHYKQTKQLIGLGPCDLLYYDEGRCFSWSAQKLSPPFNGYRRPVLISNSAALS